MGRIGVLVTGMLLVAMLPVHAQTTELPGELLGRRNPYRPLIGAQRAPVVPPSVPSAPDLQPTRLPSEARASVLDRLAYVGIAYDASEAIAAVSDGERTWFVRKGDRLEGAALTSISPNKLTWSRKGRLIVKHLRREGVY